MLIQKELDCCWRRLPCPCGRNWRISEVLTGCQLGLIWPQVGSKFLLSQLSLLLFYNSKLFKNFIVVLLRLHSLLRCSSM
jgi:hypothetical protein